MPNDARVRPIRVLLAIEESQRERVLSKLSAAGFIVIPSVSQDIAELSGALASSDFDLLIAPPESWTVFLSQIQQRGVDIPVLIVGEGLDKGAAVNAIRQGAADVAAGDLADLPQAVTHILQVRRHRASRVREAKAERRFRELMEAAPDAIIEVDREGQIVLLNAVTEKMFGYHRDELLGMSVDLLIPTDLRSGHAAHRSSYWSRPSTRPMGGDLKLLALRKDGMKFPVEISLSPVKSEEGFRVTAIIRDVTGRKRAEEQMQAIQEQFTVELTAKNSELELRNHEVERANSLKSEFLASVSHELRTPLHTIIGFCELLMEQIEGSLNDKQSRFLGHMHQDALHLLELINDVLDLSKIEAGRLQLRPTVFEVHRAIEEVLASIASRASAKAITLESRVGRVSLIADPLRFKEILLNLLTNAVKFTPDGGRVWIESSSDEGFLCLSVQDTGIGIPFEEHETVFDKFYQVSATTKGIREGTGLGLAITRRLVELHGGRVWLDSKPGKGSKFSFTLPLHSVAPDQVNGRKPLVLVVDNEFTARELLVSYLEPHGYRTECAASVDEALEKARDLRPDAITLDVIMPGKTGWDALRELRKMPETATTPIFVVSVLDQGPAALSSGASEYLTKPVRREVLLAALEKHVRVPQG
jgi:PAS domain S-box-containing protein